MQCAASMGMRFWLCFALLAMAGNWGLAGEQIPNPAYKRWTQAKVGSWTKMEAKEQLWTKGENGGADRLIGVRRMTFTFTLVEVTAEKAVVKMAQTLHLRERDVVGPEAKVEVPAMVDADKADTAMVNHDGQATVTNVERGQEDLQVLNKTLKCQWIEATVARGNQTGRVKVWYSDEIPGGMVRTKTVKTETSGKTIPAGQWVTMRIKLVATEPAK